MLSTWRLLADGELVCPKQVLCECCIRGLMPPAPWLKSFKSEGSLYSVESIGAPWHSGTLAPLLEVLLQLPLATVCPPVRQSQHLLQGIHPDLASTWKQEYRNIWNILPHSGTPKLVLCSKSAYLRSHFATCLLLFFFNCFLVQNRPRLVYISAL